MKLLFLPLLLLALVAACDSGSSADPTPSSDGTPVPTALAQEQLDWARGLWEKNGQPSYRFVFNWRCFCPAKYTQLVDISVTDGTVRGVVTHESGTALADAAMGRYMTVIGLFEFIQDAIDRDVSYRR